MKAPGATRTARASGLQPPRDDLSGLLAEFERTLAEADKQLREEEDLAEQAAGIRRESERRRPGEEVDVELKELVVTWKAASRLAADEVFEIVKARVARWDGHRLGNRKGRTDMLPGRAVRRRGARCSSGSESSSRA